MVSCSYQNWPDAIHKIIYMAKRSTTLTPKDKSRRSHKTKKRLEIKHTMLAKKAAKKKSK